MKKLPGVFLIEEVRKVRVREGFNLRDRTDVRGHLIMFGCLPECGQGLQMHLPVEGRILQADETDGFEPARPRCLKMDFPLRYLSDMGEDRELIASRVDGDLIIPVMLSDENMVIELLPEGRHLSPVINPLLELTDESGGKGIDSDPSVMQSDHYEEMELGRGWERDFVDGDFKIDEMFSTRTLDKKLMDFLGKVNGLMEEENIAFNFLL